MLIALTRAVAPSLNRCELTHLARAPIDVALAVRQHEQYEAALREAGCSIAHAAPEPDLPDSVFIEDTAVVCDEVAVVTRPGAASRRPETAAVTASLRAFRRVEAIEAPGTLDGGDVLVAGRTVYVGVGARSNVEGARQLEERLSPYGYEVRLVPVNGCLHLKSAATLVSPTAVLVNPAWVDALVFASLDTVLVDPGESFAANALLLGDRILYSPAYPRTRALLERRGLRVVPVDLSELAKAEGALTCCSLVFKRDTDLPSPSSTLIAESRIPLKGIQRDPARSASWAMPSF